MLKKALESDDVQMTANVTFNQYSKALTTMGYFQEGNDDLVRQLWNIIVTPSKQ